MKRVFVSSAALLLVIGMSSLFLSASSAIVPSGTWAPTGDLAKTRAGAAAVLLSDGVVMIAGGSGPEGRTATVERYNLAGGTFIATASMRTARANHTATVLDDGRVLVIGGFDADGAAINSAEIYDPATNTWAPAGTLLHARAGHTATLLPDGRVLAAGGENGDGALATIEVYSPVFEEFVLVASPMTSPRMRHAAAIAGDKVLIAGGWDGEAALASVDVYDPATDSLAAGPAMLVARAEHSATPLLSGDVLMAGGMNTEGELRGAEVFRSAAGAFAATANSMDAARRNHIAILLPHNNSVLIAGGSSNGAASATAQLYRSWQDGGIFVSTGSSAAARNWSAGSALSFAASATNRGGPADGLVLVAGGEDTSSAELYGFATVKTDKDDYQPGDVVYVSGSGWQPNEPVTFYVRELPAEHFARLVTIDADGAGNISGAKLFDVEEHHLNVRFLLTAADGVSQAHMTFTDSNPQSIAVEAPTSVTVAPGGTAVFGNVTVKVGGNNDPCTVTLGVTPLPTGAVPVFGANPSTTTGADIVTTFKVTTTTSTPDGTFTFQVSGTNSDARCQGPGPTASNTITLIVKSPAVDTTTTASPATATYGDESVALLATVDPSPNVGTVVFTIKNGAATVGTPVSGTVTAGVASADFALSGVNAGTYTIEAAYSGGTGFNPSTNVTTQIPLPDLIVGKAASTTTVNCGPGPFTYNGAAHEPCMASVSGAGLPTQSLPVSYTDNVDAGTATASATFAETGNHFGSSDSETFAIGKAATTTAVTCDAGPFTYNGAAQTPCTANVTGAGELNQPVTVTYTNNVNAGTATASATFAETGNHFSSSDSQDFTIGKAAATVVVTGYTGDYDGAEHGATGTVTGADAGGVALGTTLDLGAKFTNVPGGTASWTFNGGNNYTDQNGTVPIVINQAVATVTVIGYTGTYDGAEHGATGTVTGVDAGGAALGTTLNLGAKFIDVPGGDANWSFEGGINYTDQNGTVTITITKATPVVTVTFGATPITFDGDPHPAVVTVTGVSGPLAIPGNGTTTISYTKNGAPFIGTPTLVGNYTASATFTSTNGNYTNASSTTNALLTILTACSSFNGFLSPIGGAVQHASGGSLSDPVRSFKLNSTIPVKFAATCFDAPLLTGIQTLTATKYSNTGTADPAIDATPTDAATSGNQFRLTGTEWHFNLSTKALGGGAQGIWLLEATLFDGSSYTVWIEIKR